MKRDKEIVKRTMKMVKSDETSPEITLRKELWKKGFRYRKNVKNIIGKPDIANRKLKIALFIDGDFWHGNQYKTRGFKTIEEQFSDVSNKEYWIKKIQRNIDRDNLVNNTLKMKGWTVIRVWESEIKNDSIGCADRIIELINKIT